MSNKKNDIIFEIYKKSKKVRMRILWNYFRKDSIEYFTVNIIVAILMALSHSYKYFVCYFALLIIGGIYIHLRVSNINNRLNDILFRHIGYQKFNYEKLNQIFGAKALQIVYFSYLLTRENINQETQINYCKALKFKTKDHVNITEKGIFSAFISLVTSVLVSLSIVAVTLEEKLPLENIAKITLFFALLIFFIIYFIYKIVPMFERKVTEEKNIKNLLKYLIETNKIIEPSK